MRPKIIRRVLLIVCLAISLVLTTSAQQILNGSFENHDLDCGINLSNAEFNAHVPDVLAFGGQSEIDLLSGNCGYDLAFDGEYFIALYNFHFSDAFTLLLNQPLQTAKNFHLRFAARLGVGIENHNTTVQIGVSNVAEDFGQMIYFASVPDTLWKELDTQFTLDKAYSYITVRLTSLDETWVFLDDFSLDCPVIDLGRDTAYCEVNGITLDAGPYFESYEWSDLSMDATFTVHSEGIYWIEAKDGECIIRDTIQIDQLPYHCNCPFILPNVFTPNGDGVNDVFIVRTPCEPLEFQLQVFDRWGSTVFKTSDIREGWEGSSAQSPIPPGVYTWTARYRFYYHDVDQFARGTVTVLR